MNTCLVCFEIFEGSPISQPLEMTNDLLNSCDHCFGVPIHLQLRQSSTSSSRASCRKQRRTEQKGRRGRGCKQCRRQSREEEHRQIETWGANFLESSSWRIESFASLSNSTSTKLARICQFRVPLCAYRWSSTCTWQCGWSRSTQWWGRCHHRSCSVSSTSRTRKWSSDGTRARKKAVSTSFQAQ